MDKKFLLNLKTLKANALALINFGKIVSDEICKVLGTGLFLGIGTQQTVSEMLPIKFKCCISDIRLFVSSTTKLNYTSFNCRPTVKIRFKFPKPKHKTKQCFAVYKLLYLLYTVLFTKT